VLVYLVLRYTLGDDTLKDLGTLVIAGYSSYIYRTVYVYVKNYNYQIQNFEKEAWKVDTINAVYLHYNLSGDTNKCLPILHI